MRTINEIYADMRVALKASDAAALRRLAVEMSEYDTPYARSTAANALGAACLITSEFAEAIVHFQQELAAYEQSNNLSGIAGANCNIGHALVYLGKNREALEYYGRAIEFSTTAGNTLFAANTIKGMGHVYLRTGDYPAAYEQFKRAAALYDDLGDLSGAASCLDSLGILLVKAGDFPNALEHYRRAQSLYEEIGARTGLASVYSNMGIMYRLVRDHPAAIDHLQRAIDLYTEYGMVANIANCMGNLGLVYFDMGDYEKALTLYQQDLAWHERQGNADIVARVTGNMIEVLLRMHRDAEAADLLDKQGMMPLGEPDVQARHQANRAVLAERSDNTAAAREHLLKALEIVTTAGMRPQMAEYHELLRDLAKRCGNFDDYIHHNDALHTISEEIRGREATQKMAMVEAERTMEAERRERDKERALLYGALPESVATRMLRGEDVTGDHFDNAAVLFLDIVGFTAISDQLHPAQVVQFLEQIFSSLDEICKKHELTKIKTIGDSYMAVSFPRFARNDSALASSLGEERGVVERAARAALEMIDAVSHIVSPNGSPVQVRLGVHSGAVTAGVLGKERLQYDVWGDTVNVASRMESTGEPGKIHVSEQFAFLLTPSPSHLRERGASVTIQHSDEGPVIPSRSPERSEGGSEEPGTWHLAHRGETEVKGKGLMSTYWLERA